MQPVNLSRETSISLIISTLDSPQIVQIRANLCNLWISLYTASNAPKSLKSPND
jgi:hypothetical protein